LLQYKINIAELQLHQWLPETEQESDSQIFKFSNPKPGFKNFGTEAEPDYGPPFVKILYQTDLAQKLLSLRIFSYLSARISLSLRRDNHLGAHFAITSDLCAQLAVSVHI